MMLTYHLEIGLENSRIHVIHVIQGFTAIQRGFKGKAIQGDTANTVRHAVCIVMSSQIQPEKMCTFAPARLF